MLRIPELDDSLVGIAHGITLLQWKGGETNTTLGLLKDYRHYFFTMTDRPPFAVKKLRITVKMACIWSIVSDSSDVQLNGNC